MNTVDLKGVEILRPGVWNGRPYSLEELHQMVDSFHELAGVYSPPGKLGHNPEQNLLTSDGLPAAGWVQHLYLRGERLCADFAKVPAKLAELIQAGGYRTRSAEVWFNAQFEGKAYPVVLKAVSWLGADAPAVKGLNDIVALYADSETGAVSHVAELAVSEKEGAPKSPPRGKPKDRSQYADPTNYEYPIDEKHIRAAVNFFNRARGKEKYTGGEWASIGRKIASAANRLVSPGHSYSGGKIQIKDDSGEAKMADYVEAIYLFDDGSFREITDAVRDALEETYPSVYQADGQPPSNDAMDGPSANIVDLYQDRVVVTDQDCDALYLIPYTVDDDGCCCLGEPQPVRRQYIPLPSHPDETGSYMSATTPTEELPTTMTDAELRAMLGIGEEADIKQAVLSLKAQHVELADHEAVKTELATLKQTLAVTRRDDLIKTALADGKLAPSQKEWAEEYCLSDITSFEKYLATAPKVVALGEAGREDHDPGAPETLADDLTMKLAKEFGQAEAVAAHVAKK